MSLRDKIQEAIDRGVPREEIDKVLRMNDIDPSGVGFDERLEQQSRESEDETVDFNFGAADKAAQADEALDSQLSGARDARDAALAATEAPSSYGTFDPRGVTPLIGRDEFRPTPSIDSRLKQYATEGARQRSRGALQRGGLGTAGLARQNLAGLTTQAGTRNQAFTPTSSLAPLGNALVQRGDIRSGLTDRHADIEQATFDRAEVERDKLRGFAREDRRNAQVRQQDLADREHAERREDFLRASNRLEELENIQTARIMQLADIADNREYNQMTVEEQRMYDRLTLAEQRRYNEFIAAEERKYQEKIDQRDRDWELQDQNVSLDPSSYTYPELTATLQKQVGNLTDEVQTGTTNINRIEGLIGDIDKYGGQTGFVGNVAEAFKNFAGAQGDVSVWKTKFTQLVNSEAVQNLPPGVASDKDIELVLAGYPDNSWNHNALRNWLRGYKKLLTYITQQKKHRAEWIEGTGRQTGWENTFQYDIPDLEPGSGTGTTTTNEEPTFDFSNL